MPHADILDARQPLSKPLAGSVLAHAAIAGAFLLSYILKPPVETFGEKTASSGSVGVNITKTIPIPQREGRVNKLAHDTESVLCASLFTRPSRCGMGIVFVILTPTEPDEAVFSPKVSTGGFRI